MTDVITAFILIIIGVAWTELLDWLPWIARRVISHAISATPHEIQDRMREELLAELAVIPGKLSPLFFALSVWWGFWRTSIFDRLTESLTERVVRVMDIAFGAVVLVLLLPTFFVLSVAVLLTARGPFLVRNRCAGKYGASFNLLRFRTRDSRNGGYSVIGKFLIRTSLDRLPVLINVVRGDMSLVGPPLRGINAVDSSHSGLRPGMVWLEEGSPFGIESFGRSPLATVRVYFHAIRRAVVSLLSGHE